MVGAGAALAEQLLTLILIANFKHLAEESS